jgi:hypothetical protein
MKTPNLYSIIHFRALNAFQLACPRSAQAKPLSSYVVLPTLGTQSPHRLLLVMQANDETGTHTSGRITRSIRIFALSYQC